MPSHQDRRRERYKCEICGTSLMEGQHQLATDGVSLYCIIKLPPMTMRCARMTGIAPESPE